MLYHPDLIVYLWLFPVFLFLLLPLLAAPFIIVIENLIKARKSEAIKIYAPPDRARMEAGEHRVKPGMAVGGVTAYISDGTHSWKGAVTEISQDGIRLTSPPEVVNKEIDRLGVLLNFNGKCFPIQVKPQWNMNSRREKNIDAKITGGYWDWDEFAQIT